MTHTVEALGVGLELDTALQYAVTTAWEDLTKPVESLALRVEYLGAPGSLLDHLSVWSVRAGGNQELVCNYWTRASLTHPGGTFFANQYNSDQLARSVGFVMENQNHFMRLADASRQGLVQVHPPDAEDRKEASSRMRMMQVAGRERGAAEAPVMPEDHRQHEEALSQIHNDGYSRESAASLPDATGYSDYEWSPVS